MKPRITVITATVGEKELMDCVDSVENQTVRVNHLIVVDGNNGFGTITSKDLNVINLPFNTGKDGYYGHRIYAAFSLLVDTEFVAFLDADCTLEPTWAEKMLAEADANPERVITCRRNLVYNGELLGVDDSESVGQNKFGYHLYDTNTYLFPSNMMIHLTRLLHDKWGMDRRLAFALQDIIHHITNPLVNYSVREDRLEFYRSIV